MTEPSPRDGGRIVPALPRESIIVVTFAAILGSALAVREFSGIVAPVLLALVLVIAVQPLRDAVVRRGLPAWAATLVQLVAVYAIVVGFWLSLVVVGARFAALLGSYEPQFEDFIDNLGEELEKLGVGADQVHSLLGSLDLGKLVGIATNLIGGVAGMLSSIFFIVILLFFAATDAGTFARRLTALPEGGTRMAQACGIFAQGTRSYLGVSTVFGLAVALVDVGMLYALDIRDPWLWGLLAFLTNYIPNVGFIIGLVPPSIIALLDHGVGDAVAVVAGYSIINFVLQTLVQPRVVGVAVGLSGSVSFLSLVVWTAILGGAGAILAVPLTIFVKAMLVDVNPDRQWVGGLLSGGDPAPRTRGRRDRRKKTRDSERASEPAEQEGSA
ncbi:conserved membrane hypothetical protein [Nostocoides japonicum T1-X7]|uniref:AI-2E family transporter n=1 Tax=Nostocoides japonicum T1-X7 TaxID=1194083 RepID=A0A077LX14_9MICO|nr:AI-2E family transporter [Tetrasphaera japonica]CCH76480.1 conserved membrane hypothetical protein [Tetrasphaera japonica T1-X7]